MEGPVVWIDICNNIHFDYLISKRSLRTNVSRMRAIIFAWAESHCEIGDVGDWSYQARHTTLLFTKVYHTKADSNLWIDSSDFIIKNVGHYTPRSPEWSFKENKPGRRFMVVTDARLRVRKIWRGYSPKVHDGTFLANNIDYFEQFFTDAVFLGDNHFSRGRNLSQHFKFHTNYAIREGKKTNVDGVDADIDFTSNITAKMKKFNAQHRSTCKSTD